SQAQWAQWVSDNANVESTTVRVAKAGAHTVKIWMVDPGLDFERIVIAARTLPRSYLGPPESHRLAELEPAPQVHQGVLSKLDADDRDRRRVGRRRYAIPGI
ncbi:MAG TPA: hypothetical protein VGI35_02675, partial [Steroidobacteraceae bacterium]